MRSDIWLARLILPRSYTRGAMRMRVLTRSARRWNKSSQAAKSTSFRGKRSSSASGRQRTKQPVSTRSFEEAARKLGVQLVYVTDRCHELEDPWGDQAIPAHFESPEEAAHGVIEKLRGQEMSGVLALGDRPAAAAAYAARALGVPYNHPAAVEACRRSEEHT